ncbi:MAG: class I SAM-dependent methyltransferase [Microbacteriaceae bacterium]
MDRSDVELLFTPEAVELLESLPPIDSKANVVRNVTALRKRGVSAEMTSVVLLQRRLRTIARAKFGEFADTMFFTENGLQQATRLAVAAHHAERFRGAHLNRVADLGCGIGGDSLAFAGLGIAVTAVDRDEVTAAIATYNLAPFPECTVIHGEAVDVDLTAFDGLWFDPARRNSTKRLANPADWSPSLNWVFEVAARIPSGIKLSPAIDHNLLPDDVEAQWVDDHGDTVECVVWTGALARSGIARSALVLTDGAPVELTGSTPNTDVPVGALGDYLYDPCGAVIRAQLLATLAGQLEAVTISPEIAYLSNQSGAETPFAQRFRVREVLPLDQRTIAQRMKELGIGTLEIKKRGVDIDPAQFRTKLKLSGRDSATLFLTRIGSGRGAILADRV